MVFTKYTVSKDAYYYYVNHGDMGIVWRNVIYFVLGHLAGVWAAYDFVDRKPYATGIWTYVLCLFASWGVAAGGHRMWAHRSYQATWPLRLVMMLMHTVAGQNCLYTWTRDHRVHHKWSDTDADPHNTKRGFFFTHCGWLMTRRHPEMLVKAKTLDYSDLLADPLVRFQKDHYYILYTVFALYMPVAVPVYFWNERWITSILVTYVGRYLITLHATWFVNSAAHMWGDRPYNHDIGAVENEWVSWITFGEGYHNYHHQFPSDYRASEDGHGFNFTRHLIEFMAKLGWTYNLRKASDTVVEESKFRNLTKVNNNDGLKDTMSSGKTLLA
ncbi:Delta(9)-fatty-acid desaturase fat-7 [Halotydeus destructor]|nr:Delta(9)-fatty-acid desaturase fat-7 [Halotydeus destructor]